MDVSSDTGENTSYAIEYEQPDCSTLQSPTGAIAQRAQTTDCQINQDEGNYCINDKGTDRYRIWTILTGLGTAGIQTGRTPLSH